MRSVQRGGERLGGVSCVTVSAVVSSVEWSQSVSGAQAGHIARRGDERERADNIKMKEQPKSSSQQLE